MGMFGTIKEFLGLETRHKRSPKILTEPTDENLKEIVNTIYDLQGRLYDISRHVAQLSRQVDTLKSYVRPTGQAAERDKLEKEIRYLEDFLKRCEAMLGFMKKNRDAASDHIDKDCRSLIEKVRSGVRNIDPFKASGPDPYKSFSETLHFHSDRLIDLVLYLCGLAEDEMEGGKRDGDKLEILRAMEELARFSGLDLISPRVGERYNEHEHDVIDQERRGRRPAESIAKVHAIGFKRMKTGEVLKKARISLAM
jgi:hypothetical protein